MDFQKSLKAALAANHFEWRKHALERIAEREIPQEAVLEVFSSGEIVEDYPDSKPYHSALFLGWKEGKPCHCSTGQRKRLGVYYYSIRA